MSRRRNTHTKRRGASINKQIPAFIHQGNTGNTPIKRPVTTPVSQPMTTPGAFLNPLPRSPLDNVPFGPLTPLTPDPLDPSRPDTGRPEPRISEYEIAWNLPGNHHRYIPWSVLRATANTVDVLRRCIEIRKRHIRGLDWTWTVSASAIEDAMKDTPDAAKVDVEARLRDQLAPDIARLNAFWERPWRANGLNFDAWVAMIMEEHLVLDAIAIYPRRTYGGDVTDLEIIDGTTIKPLLDWRGARPEPPHPAFQQDLYGFPRGEFTATIDDTPNGQVVPGAFAADQLYYHRSVPRTYSPYGFSAVEEALLAARLYLKRQQWMLSEYDDGTMPVTWLVPEPTGEQLTLLQRREWEEALNDELMGNTTARHRVKISPKGFVPHETSNEAERYKPEYDLHLIKLIATHLDVTIAELGWTETGGLGSSGYHEGQEDVEYRKGIIPDAKLLTSIIHDISRTQLDSPAALEFTFLGLDAEDEAATDAIVESRIRSGRMTINEGRDRIGEPRFNFPEADMPMIISERGVIALEGAAGLAASLPGQLIAPAPPVPEPPEGQAGLPDGSPEPSPTPGEGITRRPEPGGSTPPAAAQKAANPTTTVEDSTSIRDRVRQQLTPDYPKNSMDWLNTAIWTGPETVPTADIDYSNEKQWQAAHEPGKVDKFTDKIQQGKLKPVVLLNTPDARKYIVIDGHHRALAYRKLGIPTMAYVGTVPTKTGPWDTFHSKQRVSDDPDSTATAPQKTIGNTDPEEHNSEIRKEITAYKRWMKRNPDAKRPFTFQNPVAELIAKGAAGGGPPKVNGPDGQ